MVMPLRGAAAGGRSAGSREMHFYRDTETAKELALPLKIRKPREKNPGAFFVTGLEGTVYSISFRRSFRVPLYSGAGAGRPMAYPCA